jgi:hypothetical protein
MKTFASMTGSEQINLNLQWQVMAESVTLPLKNVFLN